MKIFNWVHRKFHHKDGFGENVKKAAETSVRNPAKETQELLEHVSIDNILTIGTFGFGQLKEKKDGLEYEKEESSNDEEEEEYESGKEINECDGEEEVNPLLLNSFRGGFAVEINYEVSFEAKDFEGYKGKEEKKERITLADLLVADSDVVIHELKRDGRVDQLQIMGYNYKKKPDVAAKKKGLSLAKKLIPSVGEDTTRPIKKLNKLMRRMMKRKIHPDIEENFQKGTAVDGLIADEYGANESVSLLQTQVSIVRQ